jgi:hypothetical protein
VNRWQLEQWLADWFERNSDGAVRRGEGSALLYDIDAGRDVFDISELAERLATALAEAGAVRPRDGRARSDADQDDDLW